MKHARQRISWWTARGVRRVPEIVLVFWVIKALSTALGEATSDYLVHAMVPELAVMLGFAGFVVAILLQFRQGRYVPWAYWLAVVMVGIFGTMAADVLHVAFHVPYTASSVVYGLALAAIFLTWDRVEGTLSIHSIDTPRREAFYWAAVCATFAMGTALGDFTAITLGIGYFASAALFAGLIALPALGYAVSRNHAVLYFWVAYVVTRPLGASVADGLSKPKSVGGMGLGDGPVAVAFALAIVLLVVYLSVTGRDVQVEPAYAKAFSGTRTPQPRR
jgi:uncharacterized membrane-anchored protein